MTVRRNGAASKSNTKVGWGGVVAQLCAALLVTFVMLLSPLPAPAADEAGAEQPPQRLVSRFILKRHDGRPVTDQDLRGRHSLMFFGYIHCPDICPTNLNTLTRVLDLLGPLASAVQPIFITLDPERDNGDALASYVTSFHPRLIGLTGPPAMLERVARDYRVKYQIVPGQRPGEYSIDHTASIFHVGPDGAYRGRFGAAETAEAIAASLRTQIAGGAETKR